MILEEETFEAFGYYPKDLTHGSGKLIIAACELCGEFRVLPRNDYRIFCKSCVRTSKNNSMYGRNHTDKAKALMGAANKGKHRSKESRLKQSTSIKGEKNHNFGVSMSEEQKALISTAMKGDKNPNFGTHFSEERKALISAANKGKKATEETKALLSAAAIKRMHNSPPAMTAPEKVFECICKKFDLPFICNVNAKMHIGNAVPDFVHTSKKIVVEVFGDYWHSPLLRNIRYNETVEGRTVQLKKEGYKCIVIWESDLKREDAEAFVIRILKKEKII